MIPFARIMTYGNVVENLNIKKISSGRSHYVVLKENGDLWGIGYNNYKQLKDCTVTYQYDNFLLLAKDVVDVWCGHNCTLFYSKDGTWTFNGTYDAIGTRATAGDMSPQSGADVTSSMPPYSSVKEIDLGLYSSAYIDQNDDLYTRGYNSNGACGNGTTIRVSAFAKVGTVKVKELYVGEYSMIARGVTPSPVYVYGAGKQPYGQFGQGNTTDRLSWGVILNGGTSGFMANDSSTVPLWTATTFVGAGWQIRGQLGNNIVSNTQATSWLTNIVMPSRLVMGSKIKVAQPTRNLYYAQDGKFYSAGIAGQNGFTDDKAIFTAIPQFTTVSDNTKVSILGGQNFTLIFDGINLWGVGPASMNPGKPVDNSQTAIFTKLNVP